jgi:uncharacterized membrane protein YqhA
MAHKLFSASRFIVIIGVIGAFLAALTTLVFGGIRIISIIGNIINMPFSDKSTKMISVSFMEVIDLFLIGIVFYIISLGLYELFIDDSLELPSWLVIHSLDDLKNKLINGMVVIMAVYFLGELVNSAGQTHLVEISISISLMISVLAFYQFLVTKKTNHQ